MEGWKVGKILKILFESIFWPAAAGNVFWSFCSLIIKPEKGQVELISLLIILLVLSFYLTINWLRIRTGPESFSGLYAFFEFMHLFLIVLCSIAAQSNESSLEVLLAAFFIVTTIGHFIGAWSTDGYCWRDSLKLAAINVTGLGVIVVGSFAGVDESIRLPLSLSLVFCLWLLFGRGPEIPNIIEKVSQLR